MAITLKPNFLALLLGGTLLAGAAWAQDGAADPAEANEAAAAAATEATEAADAGDAQAAKDAADDAAEAAAAAAAAADAVEGAVSGPQDGDFYVKESFGDWQMRCIRVPGGDDPCELFQLLTDEQDNPVAEAALIPIGGEQVAAGLTITAPLETDLNAGLGFGIDSNEMRAYPFSVCLPIGCVARLGLGQDELNTMLNGAKGTVAVLPFGLAPDERVELPMSLSGVTAGYKALETHIAELTAKAEQEAQQEDESDADATPEDAAPEAD